MRLLWGLFPRATRGAVAWGVALATLAIPLPLAAQVYNVPPDTPPTTLTSGQVLYLGAGGVLPGAYNALAGSTIYVTGGEFSDSGGSRGTVIVRSGSTGPFFDAEAGSRIYMSGGNIGFGYDAFSTSQTVVAGGTVSGGLNILSGAQFTIVGRDFRIAGVPVAGLDDPWDQVIVTTFNGARLTGTYHNGGTFGFDLNAVAAPLVNARFHPGSTLRLVLGLPGDFDRNGVVDTDDFDLWQEGFGQLVVPGTGGDGNFDGVINSVDFTQWRNALPATLAGDYNRDGSVNHLDYSVWKAAFGTSPAPGQGADGNGDGVVNAADYVVWRNHLTAGGLVSPESTAVPEPGGLLLAAMVLLGLVLARGKAGV